MLKARKESGLKYGSAATPIAACHDSAATAAEMSHDLFKLFSERES